MATPNWADVVYDSGLNFFTGGAVTRVDVCSTEPTTYAEATATHSKVSYTLVGGDFTKANGVVSGRKVTLGAKSGAVATAAGLGSFLAFTDGASLLYGVISGDGDSISVGQVVNIAATDVLEILDSIAA